VYSQCPVVLLRDNKTTGRSRTVLNKLSLRAERGNRMLNRADMHSSRLLLRYAHRNDMMESFTVLLQDNKTIGRSRTVLNKLSLRAERGNRMLNRADMHSSRLLLRYAHRNDMMESFTVLLQDNKTIGRSRTVLNKLSLRAERGNRMLNRADMHSSRLLLRYAHRNDMMESFTVLLQDNKTTGRCRTGHLALAVDVN